MKVLYGCDTFVVLPSVSDGPVVFGKNSDRPHDEVQCISYFVARDSCGGEPLSCTYISVDQAEKTHAVVLSRPCWMWGAEMGANEHGLVIGNEAVWTTVADDGCDRLLGMDLLRLTLERAQTASEAVDVLTGLLETYGQGGNCAENFDMRYHNSFLIADRQAAWILETAGISWVAERVSSRFRNISNSLSIGNKFDRCSADIRSDANIDFATNFGTGSGDGRFTCGRKLLETKSRKSDEFTVKDMADILRDKASGICMSLGGSFVSTASQISVLSTAGDVHYFTATPDPSVSVFKPFRFNDASENCSSSTDLPYVKGCRGAPHKLYSVHNKSVRSNKSSLPSSLHDLENEFFMGNINGGYVSFSDAVQQELIIREALV